ncbi:hypothetical protein C0J52_01064 [Blattella germanica]|nr:hypothetical protein C0J52_01064 [Blattella germanica]
MVVDYMNRTSFRLEVTIHIMLKSSDRVLRHHWDAAFDGGAERRLTLRHIQGKIWLQHSIL